MHRGHIETNDVTTRGRWFRPDRGGNVVNKSPVELMKSRWSTNERVGGGWDYIPLPYPPTLVDLTSEGQARSCLVPDRIRHLPCNRKSVEGRLGLSSCGLDIINITRLPLRRHTRGSSRR